MSVDAIGVPVANGQTRHSGFSQQVVTLARLRAIHLQMARGQSGKKVGFQFKTLRDTGQATDSGSVQDARD